MAYAKANSLGKTNEDGFALILFAPIVLLLVAILSFLGTGFMGWTSKAKIQLECERLALGSQTEIENQLRTLMKQNSKAKALWVQHKLLQARLGLALSNGNVPLIAALKAELAANQKKRLALQNLQLSLIREAEATARKWATLMHTKLKAKKLKSLERIPLIVVGEPPAPEYQFSPDFLSSTKITAEGEVKLTFTDQLRIPWACSSEFHFQKDLPKAILTEAS